MWSVLRGFFFLACGLLFFWPLLLLRVEDFEGGFRGNNDFLIGLMNEILLFLGIYLTLMRLLLFFNADLSGDRNMMDLFLSLLGGIWREGHKCADDCLDVWSSYFCRAVSPQLSQVSILKTSYWNQSS